MSRVYNFAAGPAMMPEEALERAAAEMLSYKGTGMSVMEMSHRSAMYQEIFDHTVNLLRELMEISDEYEVLLLQGGATGQFAAVPMNLLKTGADYVDSGNFAHGAFVEAQKYGNARVIASSREESYARVPDVDADEQAASHLSGEAFPVDAPTGWTLAAWRGLPLGWCKITGGTLKNHLPKGLRRRG